MPIQNAPNFFREHPESRWYRTGSFPGEFAQFIPIHRRPHFAVQDGVADLSLGLFFARRRRRQAGENEMILVLLLAVEYITRLHPRDDYALLAVGCNRHGGIIPHCRFFVNTAAETSP